MDSRRVLEGVTCIAASEWHIFFKICDPKGAVITNSSQYRDSVTPVPSTCGATDTSLSDTLQVHPCKLGKIFPDFYGL